MTTVTKHHQDNVALACQRVHTDWNAISEAFFPGNPIEELLEIQTTGNDFHKGGKQVLILTFLLKGPTSGRFKDTNSGRVVYKPSGVEIDCRLVGDSDIVNNIAPQGYHQDESLTELINGFVTAANPTRAEPEGFTSKPLPTYRILPYNRTSVPESYGYIEFLTHDPPNPKHVGQFTMASDVGKSAMSVRPADAPRSDWLITDPSAAQVFYHQFGGLMAMAAAVSLSDLHVQNAIAHACQPHLIDLEEALKRPMKTAEETGITTWLEADFDPVGKVLDDPERPQERPQRHVARYRRD